MKYNLRPFLLFLFLLITIVLQAQTDLRVSENGRYLEYKQGDPFFYLGDTAWELFHRLNREESVIYLTDRANKGFTVIQAVVLAELDGLQEPNPYGDLPFREYDIHQPNEEYFKHVDFIISKAAELGLHIALLPTWGDKVFKSTWGKGPEIFNVKKAYDYGYFIGNRYKSDQNIIWVVGGDRNPRNNSDDTEIWRALANGITEAVGGNKNAMMTFHPQTNSSTWFHEDDWLDFNMIQTSHCADTKVWERISHDYMLQPVKPTFNGEPMYEEIPVCFDLEKNGYSDPNEVRRIAYQSLFAGAHGHTYGCNNIWQMYSPEHQPLINATKPWNESLELPGGLSMIHVRKLMESRSILERIPDQSILISENSDSPKDIILATRGEDFIFVYSSSGLPFEIQLGKIPGQQLKSSWFNPRNGQVSIVGKIENEGTWNFAPPTKGVDQDWVLILDSILPE